MFLADSAFGEDIHEIIKAEQNPDNNFAIETGYLRMSLFSSGDNALDSLNVKLIYLHKTGDNRWDYFLDYSLGTQQVSGRIMTDYNKYTSFGHLLFFGTRYYFNLDWVVEPYAAIAIGVFANHLDSNFKSLMAIPVITGGVGLDYMITPNIGLNAELSVPIVAWQFKLGLRVRL